MSNFEELAKNNFAYDLSTVLNSAALELRCMNRVNDADLDDESVANLFIVNKKLSDMHLDQVEMLFMWIDYSVDIKLVYKKDISNGIDKPFAMQIRAKDGTPLMEAIRLNEEMRQGTTTPA